MAYVNVHVSRRLKEELAWAIDKRFQVTSYKIVTYIAKKLNHKAINFLF